MWRAKNRTFEIIINGKTKDKTKTRRKKKNILIKTAIPHWVKQGFLEKNTTPQPDENLCG